MKRESSSKLTPDPQTPSDPGTKDTGNKPGHQQQGGVQNEQNKHTDKGSGLQKE